MLNQYAGKEQQYALTFGVRVAKNGPDGSTKAGSGHAITIVKITNNVIYVSNPWHPDKIEPIPREDFINMCTSLTAMPVGQNKISLNLNHNNTVATIISHLKKK